MASLPMLVRSISRTIFVVDIKKRVEDKLLTVNWMGAIVSTWREYAWEKKGVGYLDVVFCLDDGLSV